MVFCPGQYTPRPGDVQQESTKELLVVSVAFMARLLGPDLSEFHLQLACAGRGG